MSDCIQTATMIANEDAVGQRLDRYLTQQVETAHFTRSRLQSLIERADITLNGRETKASYKLRQGDRIEVRVPPPEKSRLEPTAVPFDILYEDAWIVVLNKPAGLVVHPARGAREGTLVHGLLHAIEELSGINGEERPGIVHRLDKDTTGVLVVAKSDEAHQALAEQFQDHAIRRRYVALVNGRPPLLSGTWQTELGRSPKNRLKMASVREGGRKATTHFRVLEALGPVTMLELTLETGRTHQIRVHCAEAGLAVLGDPLYGRGQAAPRMEDPEIRGKLNDLHRQLLHARDLGFKHPQDGRWMEFSVDPPADFTDILRLLKVHFQHSRIH